MTFSFDPKSSLPLVLGGNVFGWSADRDESFAVLDAFVAAGGSQIDTADSYSRWVPGNSGGESETIIGDWLTSRGNRDRLFIGTKVGALPPLNNLKRDTIGRAVEDSLRRLQTDHIDLYWAHRDDLDTPIEETVAAFDALVQAGKVRYLGASNLAVDRIEHSIKFAEANDLARYVAVQPHYNLLERAEYENGVGPLAAEHGLAALPYSALASGFLTGKYRRGITVDSVRAGGVSRYFTDHGYAVVDGLAEVAAHHGVSISAIALAWLAAQPTVLAPIASARTAEQLTELLGVGKVSLSQDELDRLVAAASS
jgi:aryl-alcohol dehydrogenase-like predicted oxidoreductase